MGVKLKALPFVGVRDLLRAVNKIKETAQLENQKFAKALEDAGCEFSINKDGCGLIIDIGQIDKLPEKKCNEIINMIKNKDTTAEDKVYKEVGVVYNGKELDEAIKQAT